MTKKTEVATTENYAIAERPEWMKDEGRGNEDVTTNDITLPRLSIIQDLSPQHKKNKEEYIEGAEVGMLFNTVSKQLYTDLVFCPVKLVKEWILWKDRKAGGGFGGSFPTELEAAKERQSQDNPNQWEVVDTDVHYGLIVGGSAANPTTEECVISMSKGAKKVSRNLNTIIKLAGGDRFARLYKLEVVDDESKNGDDYKNYKFSGLGYVPEIIYRKAEETYEAIQAGQRTVAHDDDEKGETTEKIVNPETIDDEF